MLARPVRCLTFDPSEQTLLIGMDGIPLSGSDADFLAYAARYQGMAPAAPAVLSGTTAASTVEVKSASEVFAKRVDQSIPPKTLEYAVANKEMVKVLKGDYLQPYQGPAGLSQKEIPAGWKLAEATFHRQQAVLFCKFEKPGEPPVYKVIIEACCLRVPYAHQLSDHLRACESFVRESVRACVCPAFRSLHNPNCSSPLDSAQRRCLTTCCGCRLLII